MSNEYMLIPYHLREPLLDVCMSSKLGTKEIEEIISNAPLHMPPPAHDGEVVYQRLAQIAVYGDVWFDISRETYEATKDQGITRVFNTAPPRVVDAELLEMLVRIRDDKTWRTNDNALWPDLLAMIRKHETALEKP